MLENLLCVTGTGGSGKSTLCKRLVDTGDFSLVERDSRLESAWNNLNPERIRDALNPSKFNSGKEQRRACCS